MFQATERAVCILLAIVMRAQTMCVGAPWLAWCGLVSVVTESCVSTQNGLLARLVFVSRTKSDWVCCVCSELVCFLLDAMSRRPLVILVSKKRSASIFRMKPSVTFYQSTVITAQKTWIFETTTYCTSSVYNMQLWWKFQTFIGVLLQDWIMCSLHGFPAVPPQGHVSLCEVEGRVYSMPAEQADVHTFTTAVSIIFFPLGFCYY